MKYAYSALALIAVIALNIYPMGFAHADSSLPNQASEWAGIKNIMSVMGQGTLNANDQKSLLDILDVKSAVEEGRPLPLSTSPATPVTPASEVIQKLPPRRRPSAF